MSAITTFRDDTWETLGVAFECAGSVAVVRPRPIQELGVTRLSCSVIWQPGPPSRMTPADIAEFDRRKREAAAEIERRWAEMSRPQPLADRFSCGFLAHSSTTATT